MTNNKEKINRNRPRNGTNNRGKDNDIKKDLVHIINHMFKEVEKNKSMLGRAMEKEPMYFTR